jgi:hypothetical protein
LLTREAVPLQRGVAPGNQRGDTAGVQERDQVEADDQFGDSVDREGIEDGRTRCVLVDRSTSPDTAGRVARR